MQTFTPIEYLKIDIANNYGLDRENWDTRIAWFDKNENKLLDELHTIKRNGSEPRRVFKDADNPALFFAGLCAYEEASRGEPIGYPIGLDATASGPQLLALMVGCESTAKACNLIDTGERKDFYTETFKAMQARLDNPKEIDRKQVKNAVMPAMYNSKREPKRYFGEGPTLNTFYQTMETDFGPVWELVQAMETFWDPTAFRHDWVLPDNFHVQTKSKAKVTETVTFLDEVYEVVSEQNVPQEMSRELGANVTHSVDGMVVREMTRRCSYDPVQIRKVKELLMSDNPYSNDKGPETSKNIEMVKLLNQRYNESGFLSARILDHIDKYAIQYAPTKAVLELVLTLPEKPFRVLSVHD